MLPKNDPAVAKRVGEKRRTVGGQWRWEMTNKIRNKTGWMVGPGEEGDRARKTPETWRQKTGGVMHDHDHY